MCTTADVATELQLDQPLDPKVDARLARLIRTFSAAVRSYTGDNFGTGDYTEVFDGDVRSFNVLNRPINSIAEIADMSQDPPVVQDVSVYGFDAVKGLIFPASQMQGVGFDFWPQDVPGPVDNVEVWDIGRQRWRVKYNGGDSVVPDDISGAVILWVAGIVNVAGGILSERIGDYAYTTNEALATMPGAVKLILDDYRGSRIRIA